MSLAVKIPSSLVEASSLGAGSIPFAADSHWLNSNSSSIPNSSEYFCSNSSNSEVGRASKIVTGHLIQTCTKCRNRSKHSECFKRWSKRTLPVLAQASSSFVAMASGRSIGSSSSSDLEERYPDSCRGISAPLSPLTIPRMACASGCISASNAFS